MALSQALRIRPARVVHRRCRKRTWFLSLSAIPALVACPSEAAKWDIHPSMSSDVTYTDNVALARPGFEQSAWVTQVTPGVSVSGIGSGLKVNAAYGAQFIDRSETGGGGVNHMFNGNGNAELVKQLLYFDASGSVSQQNVSLQGPLTDSNVNNTGNRTTVNAFRASPYLRHSFGQDAEGEARFTHSSVTTSTVAGGTSNSLASSLDSQSNGVDLRLTSGPAFKLYTWNVSYSKNILDYSQSSQPDTTTEKWSANGRRLITSQFALSSTVGYEKSDYKALAGNSTSGAFWNVGFDWSPTPRTRLAATFGRRYFGSTNSLDFSHRTRLTSWGARYSTDVTTTHGQALVPSVASTANYLDSLFVRNIPDPVAREAAVQSFIAQNGLPASLTVPLNFITTQTQLVKRWDASFGILGARNTILTNLFTQTSDALSVSAAADAGAGDFSTTNSLKQAGGSVLWSWAIAKNLSSSANASYLRNETVSTGQVNELRTFRVGLTQQFQPRLLGSLNVRSVHNKSNVAGSEYDENAVTAALSYRY